jgi:hypothetical protein
MPKVPVLLRVHVDGYSAEADDTLDWLTHYQPAGAYEASDPAPMPERCDNTVDMNLASSSLGSRPLDGALVSRAGGCG